MNKTKPMKPSDVRLAKTESIPGKVFEAFNELIASNWCGSEARITQSEVVALVVKKFNTTQRGELKKVTSVTVFNKGWLDVEDSYRAQGWEVEYDKPGYNENYEAFFIFRNSARRL